MFDQLEELVEKFNIINDQISQPEIIADQERWQKLMKEHSELKDIVEKYQEYKGTLEAIDEALMMLDDNLDDDFRELVKDLAAVFRTRIELRQIGVRDESRIIGGLGVCGRPFCCHGVSDKLRPVSIRMAKDQNLSLNSMKISGQCGRLLCCLSYEFDWYNEARKKLPSEGIHVYYDGTNFKITEVNLLTSMVKMMGDDGRLLEVNAKRFVKDNNKWKIQ